MITILIGKTFLKAFNQKYNHNYSAKEFFEKEFFELFFNHSKYMLWITNSPFVQMKAKQKPETLTQEERLEKLQDLYTKIDTDAPNASFAIGFPAAENKEFASTSGMVSDLQIETNDEDIFYSWIGAGLGIGVAGGFNLLINDPEIALKTYEGWKYYRQYLNDKTLERLRGNQINSWNGQWLTYSLKKDFDPDFDFTTLENEKVFKVDNNLIEVNTVNWSNLFFSLSNLYPQKTLNTYVYSFGQTNKTIGFIPMYLKAGEKLKDVFRQLFHVEQAFNDKDFQSLFGMHIKRACELGNIGLHALQPNNLKKHVNEERKISFKKEEDKIIYQSYKTWLIAMLSKNKEEIKDYTLDLAKLIQRYRAGAKGTDRVNLIKKDLFGSNNKKSFIAALTTMIGDLSPEDLQTIKQLKDEVHLMTSEEFGYFNTLLKFDYFFIEQQA